MGKEATAKLIRRQLRNVVQESLKDVLNAEMVAAIRKELGEKVDTGIKTLNSVLQQRLEAIESKSKDLHNFVLREGGKKDPEAQPLFVDVETRNRESR